MDSFYHRSRVTGISNSSSISTVKKPRQQFFEELLTGLIQNGVLVFYQIGAGIKKTGPDGGTVNGVMMKGDAIERVKALAGDSLKECGNGWYCICPAHDDHDPSLYFHKALARVVAGKFLSSARVLVASRTRLQWMECRRTDFL